VAERESAGSLVDFRERHMGKERLRGGWDCLQKFSERCHEGGLKCEECICLVFGNGDDWRGSVVELFGGKKGDLDLRGGSAC